jgi:alkylation response protein AidB-like acyl-CoA dehydrogenase
MARSFADEKLAPRAREWDEKKHFPVDVIRQAAALGMAAIYVREDVGGSAMTRFDAALIFEALSTLTESHSLTAMEAEIEIVDSSMVIGISPCCLLVVLA